MGVGVLLPLGGNTTREETFHGKCRCEGQLRKAIARGDDETASSPATGREHCPRGDIENEWRVERTLGRGAIWRGCFEVDCH